MRCEACGHDPARYDDAQRIAEMARDLAATSAFSVAEAYAMMVEALHITDALAAVKLGLVPSSAGRRGAS